MNNNLWKKIKEFFRNLFGKNEKILALNSSDNFQNEKENNNFAEQISMKEQLQKQEEKHKVAQKLLDYELSPYDLTEEEADEMTEYFIKDIEEKNRELERIKNHILSMRKELEFLNNKN